MFAWCRLDFRGRDKKDPGDETDLIIMFAASFTAVKCSRTAWVVKKSYQKNDRK